MDYSKEALKEKLIAIHPEIVRKNLNLDLEFEEKYNSWIITLSKGNRSRHAFLDKTDADECMSGNKCIYFFGLIEQYTNIFDEGKG